MVGIMAATCRDRLSSLINSIIFASDIPSKLHNLHLLKQDLSQDLDSVLLSEFLPSLLKLVSDPTSPVRKCVTEIIGEIGLKHLEFLPEIVPSLLIVVNDDTPAVARQAITSGTNIFGCTLEKIAIQGLHTSELDDSLESAWSWMLKLKEKIYSIAFQAGSDGRRLLALKFIAAIVLIYTPDPNGSAEPPSHLVGDGKEVGFNISWLRRGHPVLKVGDLSVEASQSLGLLLDQLRLPIVKSLSTSMVVVLINCLSAIATKRPSFYGRILPVLLSLDPSNLVIKGLHAYGVQHALKNAFLSCLKCTHPSAIPWRDRLVGALREMKAGELADQVLEEVFNINGNIKEEKVESVVKEQLAEVQDTVHNKVGRKRSSDQEFVERSEDDDTPGKRARSSHVLLEGVSNKSDSDRTALEVKTDSTGQATKSEEDDLGPVQQLVAVFGALIAQGDKAAASLEILISSISADLLSEVVIANLRNLPSTHPTVEAEEHLGDVASHDSITAMDTPFRELSSFLTNAFTPRMSQQTSSAVDVHPPASDDLESPHAEESSTTTMARNGACATSGGLSEIVHSDPSDLTAVRCSEVAQGFPSAPVSELQDMETADAVIPGIYNASGVGLPDTVTSSSLVSTEHDDASQDQATSCGNVSKPESVPSMSTEKSEELSAKTAAMDSNTGTISTATSLGQVQQFVLPKISAPVIDLSDEEKDKLQKFLFVRILEAYKQVAVAGGSQLRFSLLAYLGVEFPLDLDPWELLQTHILSDYINHEGHELTLRVLYRLYGEAEEEHDFFSSSTATSVYETFLLKVAETLRDSFPASDKSLSRLLGEVPYLPNSVLKLLECLCCPESGDKDEKELLSGDRVTQGLSAVWSLILLRPSLRNLLLRIALQSAVHHLEEVRMKAIRLVANKLYPLPSIALQIEEYAKERLLSVVERQIPDTTDTENSTTQLQKNREVLASNDQATADTLSKETSAHAAESCTAESISTTLISEAQRCMSLYFALCTKKHALLRQIFIFYKSSPESVKQAVHRHMPILIRTMGASPALLEIISDPPDGSENLLMLVLHTLTDGIVPSTELISTIKKLYESKMKDVEILLPILSYLPKEEVLRVFPHVVKLPQDKFQAALARLLQGSTPSGSTLSPSEVLIAIHGIDPDKDRIPLKKVTDACNACFEQKQIFTQQVIAKVLNQLVEQIPLPLLFMRTVLQAIGAFPALVDFIMDILSRLVNKQIWKYPKLWVGFLKCAQLTQPHSFNVLLQLPPTQLESALNKIPALKAPLSTHANQSNMKSTLPRSVLTVLGIASDSQAGSQSQSAQPEVADENSSDKDAVTEKSKESGGR